MKALEKDAIIIVVCKMGSLFVFGCASEESDILLLRNNKKGFVCVTAIATIVTNRDHFKYVKNKMPWRAFF